MPSGYNLLRHMVWIVRLSTGDRTMRRILYMLVLIALLIGCQEKEAAGEIGEVKDFTEKMWIIEEVAATQHSVYLHQFGLIVKSLLDNEDEKYIEGLIQMNLVSSKHILTRQLSFLEGFEYFDAAYVETAIELHKEINQYTETLQQQLKQGKPFNEEELKTLYDYERGVNNSEYRIDTAAYLEKMEIFLLFLVEVNEEKD